MELEHANKYIAAKRILVKFKWEWHDLPVYPLSTSRKVREKLHCRPMRSSTIARWTPLNESNDAKSTLLNPALLHRLDGDDFRISAVPLIVGFPRKVLA